MTLKKLHAYSNTDWITLPILITGSYPKEVIDKAKQIASSEEEENKLIEKIAREQGLTGVKFLLRAFPYDKIDTLYFIQEDPDNSNFSNLIFADGDSYIVDINFKKITKLIHEFLLQTPVYRKPIPPTAEMFIPIMGTEMGGVDTLDEEDLH